MTAIVNYCQRLLAFVCTGIDSFLVPKKDTFGGGHADIVLLNNVEVRIKAVSCYVLAEDLHII